MSRQLGDLLENIKAAVFDFDGTLVDSHKIWAKIDQDLFDQLGLVQPPNYEKDIAGKRLPEIAKYIIEHFQLTNVSQERILSCWEESYMKYFSSSAQFIDGAAEFLTYLASKNIAIGIATASTHKLVELFFSNHPEIRALISCVVTSEDVVHSKPAPDVFLKCLESLGAHPSEGIIFEDSLVGLSAATKTGSKVVCILSHPDDHLEKKELSQLQINSYSEYLYQSRTLEES
ncbi:Beta-phosphoglucomutase [Giardia duodenalis]|uniref:Beta-phosphoglucomutase n=1 Tax=Giardia intestinalis (strain ATCC 50803 / WB clone C6) TaxID=184922 RepID=A8B258_GIAIC|nr:Beta-phosphoglucomutase [Giardia intestinalis]KAE8302925.1 Beta-phosphoglucomutase [Giardia intestinalis]|eukprot:XP_001709902.1 Hydrolase, haloacid dehalogenase-like family [Giardia lamblia ATCC 50803]